jgi:hypothetical protein
MSCGYHSEPASVIAEIVEVCVPPSLSIGITESRDYGVGDYGVAVSHVIGRKATRSNVA